jgi:hypothetical protein
MSRLEQLHADCCAAADPEHAGRWTRFKHKVSKTAWSAWDHSLPDKKTIALAVAGAALSAGLAVATGGVSLGVQFAVAFAVGVGSGGLQKLVNHRNYRDRKAKIETALAEEDSSGGTRQTARMMHENLVYNEDHYLSTLAQLLDQSKKLKEYETVAQLDDEAAMQEFVRRVALFWDRYERASHYFIQFEQYVHYTHRFADHARAKHDLQLPAIERYLELVVRQSRDWHKANCRTSRFSTDVCYGLADTELEVPRALTGSPHHRFS